jgi:hypothetical protein
MNPVLRRKTNKRRTKRQKLKKKRRSKPIWIITYLNKKRKKMVLKGDFRAKMAKNTPYKE